MLGIISVMSTLNEIVKQHKKQLLKMKRKYREQIAVLPKGSLTVKKMSSGEYWYLKYREGKKVITKYIGKLSNSVMEIEKQIEQRKILEKTLRDIEKELALIRKFEMMAQGA